MDNNYLSRLKSLFSETVSNQDYLEEVKVSDNVQELLENRYFVNLFNGKENTYKQLCKRVSRVVAATELYHYSQKTDKSFDYIINHDESASELLDYIRRVEYSIYTDMLNGNFLFNSPCLFSAGTGFSATENGHLLYDDEITLDDYRKIYDNVNNKNQMLFACFVIGIEDSIEGIFESVKKCAIISKSGGGVGLNFSPLREKNAKIRGNEGLASGVVSFAGDFNAMGDSIRQGGKRRVALMGMLNSNHPDIEEFINCKTEEGKLTNFNISVAIDDKFMEAIQSDSDYDLISSADGRVVKTVKARELWNNICESAWKRGDPGIFFVDLANKDSLLKYDEDYQIVATNPSLIAGTKVLTNNGIFNIEELENQEFTVPSLISNSSAAKCFMSGENKHVNKITFKNKFTATATDEHKWVVLRNDELVKVKTSELKIGDYVPKTKFRKSLNFGTIGDREDGFLIGWLYGNGSINTLKENNKKQYDFTFSEEEYNQGICEKIVNKISSITGNSHDPSKRERNNSTWYELHTKNNAVHEYMSKFGVNTKDCGIPSSIWGIATDDFRIGFIDGLFSADSHIETSRGRIQLTSKYDKFIDDIIMLLGFYGITGMKMVQNTTSKFPNGKDYGKIYHRNDLKLNKYNSLLFRELVGSLTQLRKDDDLQNISDITKPDKYKDYLQIIDVQDNGIAEKVWDLRVNDESHSFYLGSVLTSNCGEANLPNFTSCNLGSINLANFVTTNNNKFDFDEFIKMVRRGIYYLDLVIDTSAYPLTEIEERTKNIRPVGLGLMGLADMFIKLGIKYGSEESNKLSEQIAQIMAAQSLYESVKLAEIKGSFEQFDKEPQQKLLMTMYNEMVINYGIESANNNIAIQYIKDIIDDNIKSILPISIANAFYSLYQYNKEDFYKIFHKFEDGYLRNSRRLSVAPTGTISMILNTSSSLEPNFAFEWKRNITNSNGTVETKIFKHKYADIDNKELLVTANELSPEEHVNIVKAFAPYVDASISKCVAKGTKIFTNKGFINIEDFGNPDKEIDTFEDISDKNICVRDMFGRWKKVLSHYRGGMKDTYIITFKDGFSIECSSTHKFECRDIITRYTGNHNPYSEVVSIWLSASNLYEDFKNNKKIEILCQPIDENERITPNPSINVIKSAYNSNDNSGELRCISYIREIQNITKSTNEVYDIEVEDTHTYLIDGVISHNTVNMPNNATVEDVKKVYENCYNNGIKGITIYRDMSREGQTLQKIDNNKLENKQDNKQDTSTIVNNIERPKVISGYTQKGETNYGNLYATLNVVDGKPYELFVNIGKSGSLAKSLSEALSRTISISLQNGINIDEIIKTLNGIADSETPWVFEDYKGNEEWCKSIPDMIAKMMKSLSEYVKEIGAVEQKLSIEDKKDDNNIDMNSIIEHDKTSTDKKKILCPECLKNGNSIFLVQMAGCPTCPNCGWSACA